MNECIDRINKKVYTPDDAADGSDAGYMPVICEHPLLIRVNEKPLFRLICIRDDLRELVAGRLYTEGIIDSAGDISDLFFCREEFEASVLLGKDIETADADGNTEPTCCTGNKALMRIKDIRPMRKLAGISWNKEQVFMLAKAFSEGMPIHSETSGAHSCMLAGPGGILFKCEDIGRHNAVDKAVGYGLLSGMDLTQCMIYTSGRVPVDMVEKVIMAGVPVLVSKSVPTAESVKLAQEYGLTLICRAYPDRFELVSP